MRLSAKVMLLLKYLTMKLSVTCCVNPTISNSVLVTQPPKFHSSFMSRCKMVLQSERALPSARFRHIRWLPVVHQGVLQTKPSSTNINLGLIFPDEFVKCFFGLFVNIFRENLLQGEFALRCQF